MDLTPAAQKFILHWGKMGSRWGINRTVAQIHALLFISSAPLNAEDISGTLSVARSNVSTSLRELLGWHLVEVVPVLGDRRDHYTTRGDIWEMFNRIMEERKRREIDPTVALLRECVDEATDQQEAEKLIELLAFMETMVTWYEQIGRLPRTVLMKLFKLGDKVQHLINRAA